MMMAMSSAAKSNRPGLHPAKVVFNRPLCLDHYRLRLAVPGLGPTVPGQFVNVQCGAPTPQESSRELDWSPDRLPQLTGAELLGRRPLLRRPFSIAGRIDRPGGLAEIDIIHHVVGVGTAVLAQASEGDAFSVLGPLGHGFTIHADRPLAAVLGGGVGIPPMIYLAEALKAAGKDVTAFAGARSAAVLPLTTDPAEPPSELGWPAKCTGEFAEIDVPSVVATDDGTLGFPGYVHQAFVRFLEDRRVNAADLAVYACGPLPMLKAVAETCLARGIECELALERHMGCGLGACQSCICRTRTADEPGWKYTLVCKDGPVFDAREILW